MSCFRVPSRFVIGLSLSIAAQRANTKLSFEIQRVLHPPAMNDDSRAVADIESKLESLYGAAAKRDVKGVLHVVSAVDVDGRLHVIKIGPHSPKSSTDFFVLNAWRAHADAIVTTAAVVRAEPKLSHEIQGPQAAELAQYRARRLQKTEPPIVAILTRSGELPLDHEVWSDHARNHVLTVPDREAELQRELGGRAQVVGIAELDVIKAVAWLRDAGARAILIEAGPTTANGLYTATPGVDHLMLSRYEGAIDPAAIGGELVEPQRLFAGLSRVSRAERIEESGPWRFERWDAALSN